MKNPLFYLLITLYTLTACSNGEDYREPKSEEDLSGLVLAASNGSYYQQKYEKCTDVQLFLTSNEADGVQAVRQGHADVYVSDEVMLTKDDLKRLGMKKAFVGEECFDVAFAIRKGNTEIAEQLNAFLASAPLEDITNYWINGGPYVEEPAYTIPEGAKPLYCVCAVNIAPISYVGEGGKWQGLDVDILRRFAHSVGRPFEMQFVDIGSAIMAINTIKADAVYRAQSELRSAEQEINTAAVELEAAAKMLAKMAEFCLNNPDAMPGCVNMLFETLENVEGAGIAFVPDYYPQKGHWYEVYATRNERTEKGFAVRQIGGAGYVYSEEQEQFRPIGYKMETNNMDITNQLFVLRDSYYDRIRENAS